MSVCVYSVSVLFCAALRLADPPSKESYRLCIGIRNCKSGQGPKGDHPPLRDVTADTENTAPSIVACWTVFTELLTGNALIKSVTIRSENSNILT
jgi:hypothetical protein